MCDATTWSALVEASWRLGERLLLLTSPNLRGDDVAELQSMLGRIGFDCGRVDGIFGPKTATAVQDFQENCGETADGTFGAATLRLLTSMSRQTGTGPGVSMVRERELLLRSGRVASLRGLKVVIGQFGGLSPLTRLISRELRLLGSIVVSIDEPDAIAQAQVANQFEADVYLGFESRSDEQQIIAFYAVPTFESAGGKSLASRVCSGLEGVDGVQPSVAGMRLQVLRETRMPAVLCSLGSLRHTVDMASEITVVIRDAMASWAAQPL